MPVKKRVLAVSSGGGHWAELMQLCPAFDGCDVAYVTVDRGYVVDVPGCKFFTVPDGTRWNLAPLVLTTARLAWLIATVRPHVVISTGAAVGLIALRLGKAVGARTIWVDSIANADELSLSGAKAGGFCDLWLTQWPHLASEGTGPQYAGKVL